MSGCVMMKAVSSNLKSSLSQYVSIATLIKNGEKFDLYCESPEDKAKFFVLMSEHPNMEI